MLGQLKAARPFQVDLRGRMGLLLALISRLPLPPAGAGHIAEGKLAFVWARLAGARPVLGTHLHRPSTRSVATLSSRCLTLSSSSAASQTSHPGRRPQHHAVVEDLPHAAARCRACAREHAGGQPGPPGRWQSHRSPLDHIFVSADLTVTAAGTGPAVGSDHLPIWAIVQSRASFERGKAAARGFALRSTPAQPHFGAQLLADLGGEHGGPRYLRW